MPRVVEVPTGWSKTTAWRALEDLRSHGFAHRERADNPARQNTANGGPTYAYALTERKGTKAGALAAGQPVLSREQLKQARGKYMRSKVDASRIAHRLLGNEWLAMLSAESLRQGVEILEAWAEGGSEIRASSKVVEPDGVMRLCKADGGRLGVYLESDMGTQREAAIQAKVESYGRHLVDITDYGRDARIADRLPLIVFLSKIESRSETVLDYIASELQKPLYGPTRDSLRALDVSFDNIFLVTNLRWAKADGALGDSCVTVGTEKFWSILDHPQHVSDAD